MDENSFGQAFVRELEQETTATLKCLERIPVMELFSWKPHEKSMEMGYLTLLVAEMPLWIAYMIDEPEIDFVTFPHLHPNSTQDIVDHFKENVEKAKKALLNMKPGTLDETFSLKSNGQLLFSSSKRESIEPIINHWVHHRGQLTVYMRLNDIPVPSIYGPSADEKGF